jgi:hypothetical protein
MRRIDAIQSIVWSVLCIMLCMADNVDLPWKDMLTFCCVANALCFLVNARREGKRNDIR